MRKSLMAAALAAVVGVAPAITPAVAQQGPILIGVSTPKTGPLSVASEWEMWGVDLAVEEINAAGGLLGRKVELIAIRRKASTSPTSWSKPRSWRSRARIAARRTSRP